MKKWLPIVFVGLLGLWFVASLRAPKDAKGVFAVQEFGRLPMLFNGRVQPMDSLARNSLLQLREKQSLPKMSAIEWLLEVSMKQEAADARPVFRIDNPDLKGLLALPMDADEAKQADGKHFTFNQVKEKLAELQTEARRVSPIDASMRNAFDRSVLHLWTGVGLYMRLQNMVHPQNAKNWEQELQSYLTGVPAGVVAARAQHAGQAHDKEALEKLMNDLQRFDAMQQLEPPLVVPPHHPERDADSWDRMGAALMETARGETPHYSVLAYARMSGAYREGRIADFNAAVADYKVSLEKTLPKEFGKTSREQLFNAYQPFYKAMIPYLLAFVGIMAVWTAPKRLEWLRRMCVWLIVLGLVVHVGGLITRMLLEGRPPVTNLYSSAVFIGLGAVFLGWLLEAFWKNGIGVVVASVLGFTTLIIAHHLSLGADTMIMMQAVLDTNFWLATHVVVITLGYSATFVAGFLAVIYIIRGVLTPSLDGDTAKSLGKMVYGIVCFATLFSFVGTVLGGIWADQSWGRFWGWDPKENGALLIVLWNALILHARWGGLVRERGLMNLAIVGNVITAWSWFGVNMLGIGLHSYGFMDSAFRWLMLFVGTQLVLIALGALPLRIWRSHRVGGVGEPPALAA